MIRRVLGPTLLTVALAMAPSDAAAQLASSAPRAIGMGGNYVALARGFESVSWNPAGLGLADRPGVSFTVLPGSFTAGLEPVSAGDLADYDGELVPHSARADWLDRIREHGGEEGRFGGSLTYIALSVGRFGFQASSNIAARANVGPEVAEVLLFGNAGLTGEPRDFALEGSSFDVAGTTTFAASYAVPLSLRIGGLPDQRLAVGATLTYTIGNFLLLGREENSRLTSEPLEVDFRFPIIHTTLPGDDEGFEIREDLDNGRGVGLDVGAAWTGGIFSAGVAVRNLVSTFEWELDRLEYRAGEALWTADTSYTSVDPVPATEAPEGVVDRVQDVYEFAPVLSAGVAARVRPYLTVTGEVRHAVKETLELGARNHVGVGGELTVFPRFPIRAGFSLISGGYQLAGGLGVVLGPVDISASGALRQTDLGDDSVLAVGVSYGLP